MREGGLFPILLSEFPGSPGKPLELLAVGAVGVAAVVFGGLYLFGFDEAVKVGLDLVAGFVEEFGDGGGAAVAVAEGPGDWVGGAEVVQAEVAAFEGVGGVHDDWLFFRELLKLVSKYVPYLLAHYIRYYA